MTFSLAPKLILGLALVLTVVPKAVTKLQLHEPKVRISGVQPLQAEPLAAAFLVRHGFEAHDEQTRFRSLVHATSGECRLRLMGVDPAGAFRESVRLMATQTDRIAFIFDGALYSDQPTALTILSHYWSQFRNSIGVPTPMKTIFGVAASQGCSLEELPWSELADQPLVSGPA